MSLAFILFCRHLAPGFPELPGITIFLMLFALDGWLIWLAVQ